MKTLLLLFLPLFVWPQSASMPLSVPTDLDLGVVNDRASTQLSSTINNSTLTVPVTSSARFVAGMIVTIDSEQMKICSVSSGTLTVCAGGRGFSSTSATSHSAGVAVRNNIVAYNFNRMREEVKALAQFARGTVIDVRAYGAAGDGATNDRSAIQAAINAAPFGATVYVPSGSYLLSGSGTELLLINAKAIRLECHGSEFLIPATVGTSTDVIRVQGPIEAQWGIKGCTFSPQASAGLIARHAVNLDSTKADPLVTATILYGTIEDNNFGSFSGNAIKTTIDGSYVNGFLWSVIRNNRIWNGIKCDPCGDSIIIRDNKFYGRAPLVEFRSAAGSQSQSIQHNVFMGCAPAIKVVNAHGLLISNNNIEPSPYYPPSGSESCTVANGDIEIHGTLSNDFTANNPSPTVVSFPGTAYDVIVRDNTVNMLMGMAKSGVYLAGPYQSGTLVKDNHLAVGQGCTASGVDCEGIWVAAGVTQKYFLIDNQLNGASGYFTSDCSLLYKNEAPTAGLTMGQCGTTASGTPYSISGRPVIIDPSGLGASYFQWKQNHMEFPTGVVFASLPDPTGKLIVEYCPDCAVDGSGYCASGGFGKWAFSTGSPPLTPGTNGTGYKCPF